MAKRGLTKAHAFARRLAKGGVRKARHKLGFTARQMNQEALLNEYYEVFHIVNEFDKRLMTDCGTELA